MTVAKWMPWQKQGLGCHKIGFRIAALIFCTLFLLPTFLRADSKKSSDNKKMLRILQMNFAGNTLENQRTLLREMALLGDESAVPFFVEVSLDSNYDDDIRSEALKGMLAINTDKYKPVLSVLQSPNIEEDRLIQNLQLIDGLDLLEPFLKTLTFNETRRVIDMKLSIILHSWNDGKIRQFDFSRWSSGQAPGILYDSLQATKKTDQKIHLIELWGKVRNEKTTKSMVKMLDSSEARVQEAVVLALSEPGPSAVSAIGRFLQKSKDPTLRKRAIFALRKIGDASSKAALESYFPHATAEEKKWITEILHE